MRYQPEILTEHQMKQINGGNGIVARDPVTGEPFPEETGGYPQHPHEPMDRDKGTVDPNG